MSTEIAWKGHKIQVSYRPAQKYLFLGTETVVKVDDVEIGRNSGFSYTEITTGRFASGNRLSELTLEMKADITTYFTVPYKLQVDGRVIAQGNTTVNNAGLSFWPLAFGFLCWCFAYVVNNPERALLPLAIIGCIGVSIGAYAFVAYIIRVTNSVHE